MVALSREQNRYADAGRSNSGERWVFEPYTKEAHTETFARITSHGIFAETGLGHRSYDAYNEAKRRMQSE